MSSLKLKFKVEIISRLLVATKFEDTQNLLKFNNNNDKTIKKSVTTFSSKNDKPSQLKSKITSNNNINSANNTNNNFNNNSNVANNTNNSINKTNTNYQFDINNNQAYENELNKLPLEDQEDFISYIKGVDSNLLQLSLAIIESKQFFFRFRTKTGMEIVTEYFYDLIKNKDEKSDCFTRNEFISNEFEFYYYFRDIMHISDFEAIEIFDLFKFNQNFSFNEQSFISLFYMMASLDSGALEEYFNLFSEDLFTLISGGEEVIILSRLKEVGRILNFNERLLLGTAQDLKYEINSILDMYKFKDYYVLVGKNYDDTFKKIYFQSNKEINNNSSNSNSNFYNSNNNNYVVQKSKTLMNSSSKVKYV